MKSAFLLLSLLLTQVGQARVETLSVNQNPDGSVVFEEPRILLGGNTFRVSRYDGEGLCRYLGYESKLVVDIEDFESSENVIRIGTSGEIRNSHSSTHSIKTISCYNEGDLVNVVDSETEVVENPDGSVTFNNIRLSIGHKSYEIGDNIKIKFNSKFHTCRALGFNGPISSNTSYDEVMSDNVQGVVFYSSISSNTYEIMGINQRLRTLTCYNEDELRSVYSVSGEIYERANN